MDLWDNRKEMNVVNLEKPKPTSITTLIGPKKIRYLRQSRRLDLVSRSKRPEFEPLKVAGLSRFPF